MLQITKKSNSPQLIDWPCDIQWADWLSDSLQRGEVGAFPTETCYGLGGNALLKKTAETVYHLKKRAEDHPLPTLLDNPHRAKDWAETLIPQAQALIHHYWPGSLTLVLVASKKAPAHLVSDTGKIALRWSSHPVVQALTRMSQSPIIGTSANISGQSPLNDPKIISATLSPAWVINSPVSPATLPSTVVDLSNPQHGWRLLRVGKISTQDIEHVWQNST